MTIRPQDQMSLSITRPPDSSVDYMQIGGEIDQQDFRDLQLAARALLEADASIIYVDLAAITYMGSTLIAFLEQIANTNDARPLVLCRPTPMALRLIHMTGLDQLATMRPDLPPLWPDVTSS
jgi:anti-anti-sigma factor